MIRYFYCLNKTKTTRFVLKINKIIMHFYLIH